MHNRRAGWIIGGCFLLIVPAALLALCLGRYPLSLGTVLSTLRHPAGSGIAANIVYVLRLPRILGAILIGAALAAAGSAYQRCFSNPLVSPDLLGVANGAAVGVAIAILLGRGTWFTQLAAFAGGVAAVCLALLIPRLIGHRGKLILVLSGVVVTGFMQAALGLLKYLADPDSQLPSIVYWQLGSIAKVDFSSLIAALPSFVLGFVILLAERWHLTIMATGMANSRTSGINPRVEQPLIIAGATLLTAGAVALSGTIGWVGLVIPHIARLLVGDDARYNLPLSLALGGLFMLVIDTLARTLSAGEIPLSILTGFIGTPLFILILARNFAGGGSHD